MKHIDNYGRFYGLLKRLPGADKETLVRQFTGNRTEHLRQMTYKEYDLMCREMERVAGYDERHAAPDAAVGCEHGRLGGCGLFLQGQENCGEGVQRAG